MVAEWKPDVVVSDIGLPEMDGYDFMRRLREIEGDGKRIPAIAVTGYAGALDESKALSAGYEVHLSKPIELNELATCDRACVAAALVTYRYPLDPFRSRD
jgi:CheY-like chemotaxis protein